MATEIKEKVVEVPVESESVKHQKEVYARHIKRPMDFILSLMALIVLSPVLLVVAILVKINLGSPVIFKQQRPGKDEKIFSLYKFRSMTEERDGNGELLSNEMRLTKFGRFLRSTSLDELSELINILKGDMSIVGPRPLLVEYLPLYDEDQRRRHEVRPGLTGLAQVKGRNGVKWEERFKLDIQYIDSVSFYDDWKIIFLTAYKVFRRDGINSGTSITMENFKNYSLKERIEK